MARFARADSAGGDGARGHRHQQHHNQNPRRRPRQRGFRWWCHGGRAMKRLQTETDDEAVSRPARIARPGTGGDAPPVSAAAVAMLTPQPKPRARGAKAGFGGAAVAITRRPNRTGKAATHARNGYAKARYRGGSARHAGRDAGRASGPQNANEPVTGQKRTRLVCCSRVLPGGFSS